jgi:hypothetical protein
MEKTAAGRIEEQLRSAFPEGAIERVQVLEYGDDPQVEPGDRNPGLHQPDRPTEGQGG